MSIICKIFSIIALLLLFSACTNKNMNIPKQSVIKKEIKKTPKYKYCNKHKKIMNYASKYIQNEFEKGYFSQKDLVGAKAQIFLIENNSPSIFAKNMNKAQKTYKVQYDLAKKNGCNINKFKIYPISKIKKNIKILEKKNDI